VRLVLIERLADIEAVDDAVAELVDLIVVVIETVSDTVGLDDADEVPVLVLDG
jgi:hypothetical protein